MSKTRSRPRQAQAGAEVGMAGPLSPLGKEPSMWRTTEESLTGARALPFPLGQ